MPFHPYYTMKDVFALSSFLILFACFVFFAPNYLGHPDNYIPANPLVTPPHIVPEWYFLPFYAILRAIPDKLGGVVADVRRRSAILFFLPWLDTSQGALATLPADLQVVLLVFVVTCLALGYLGCAAARAQPVILGSACSRRSTTSRSSS